MIDYKTIGRKISFYRKKAAMTQSTMSEELGVTESYISQVERGSAKVSLGRLEQIAQILSVDIALLVSDRVSVSDSPANSEIAEIIKDWSAEQVDLLIHLISCANENMAQPKE